ncbi:struthiocalcin-2-like [Colius striatus]|uniref:struthiocalcin-2-like n=1 Tax=Colius striatus TaxID=57412 RepID=UPI002B1E2549|nr:struthiocalcin-2-like [Colius striatus]
MAPTRTLQLLLLSCLLLVPRLRGECQAWGGRYSEPGACTWGWVPFEDGCYRFFPQELSWRRAEAFCQRLGRGAQLASVHSAGQHRAIAALLGSRPADEEEEEEEDGDDGAWIGLHRPLGSRRWRWADGSRLDYGSWHRQPGTAGTGCAALRHLSEPLRWHSEPCTDRKPFICKSSA